MLGEETGQAREECIYEIGRKRGKVTSEKSSVRCGEETREMCVRM